MGMNVGGVKLTPELENQILAAIRQGAYPHVAAQAFGVTKELFENWIRYGEVDKRKPYTAFARKVRQAKAMARLRAEMSVFDDDPIFWLKSGPGKERVDDPGWTAIVRPIVNNDNRTVNLFTSPDFIQFMALLRHTLAPIPGALEALSEAMDGKKKTQLPAVPYKEFPQCQATPTTSPTVPSQEQPPEAKEPPASASHDTSPAT